MSSFLKIDGVVAYVQISQKNASFWRLRCHFWCLLVKTYFLHKLARLSRSLISKKNLASPLLIFNVAFILGYYKEFTFVLIKNCRFFNKDNSVNRRIYHTVNWCSMLTTLKAFSNFKFNFDWTKALFYRSKINSHGVYVIKKKKMEEGFIQV